MRPQRTRIKICGLREEADVDAAVAAGADAVGFVMYERSVRHVSVERASALATRLPPFVTPVLLFVNAAQAVISQALAAMPQALLQFHGDESPLDCDRWERPYLRAVPMRAGVDLLDWQQRFKRASALLLDAPTEGFGGGGKTYDWSLIQRPPSCPPAAPIPLVLSGGLSAANVIDGVLTVRPDAVDVSSGVERERGVKSPALIRQFCDAVRQADARLADAVNQEHPPC